MSTPPRPWTAELLRLVDAGVHSREEIIKRLTPFIPQGYAYRCWERNRDRQRAMPRSTDRRFVTDHSDPSIWAIHRSGARFVIQRCLLGLRANGTLIVDGDIVKRP